MNSIITLEMPNKELINWLPREETPNVGKILFIYRLMFKGVVPWSMELTPM